MIADSIKNIQNYKGYPMVYKALKFLESKKNWDDVEKREDILKDLMFANKVEFITKDEKDCKYEAHKKFLDIHFIFDGEEIIDVADVKNLNEIEEFNEDADIGFYSGLKSGRYILKKGDFLLCYPSDAHKVCIMNEVGTAVKKIVIKISYELIN